VDGRVGALVAVIEDDEVARWALGRVLQAGGFEPALFESAEAFVAARHDRAPMCVIIDVHLTGMSGIELQHKLRGEGSVVPVIMTTGDRADSIRERAHQAGCAAFLWKPFTASTLLGLLGSIEREARH
jgi:FixJ family two-component response regulator